jgi:hypothetical protein
MRTRRTRKYRGGREDIPIEEAKKYFYKSDGTPYTQAEIDAAANEATNTTSSFERYLVNSLGMYNSKEAVKNWGKYCNYKGDNEKLMNDPTCIQRGARMKIALQKFANMPPQAYAQFGASSVLVQGAMAAKDTGVNSRNSLLSMFGSKPQAPAQTPAQAPPKKGWWGGKQTRRRSRR